MLSFVFFFFCFVRECIIFVVLFSFFFRTKNQNVSMDKKRATHKHTEKKGYYIAAASKSTVYIWYLQENKLNKENNNKNAKQLIEPVVKIGNTFLFFLFFISCFYFCFFFFHFSLCFYFLCLAFYQQFGFVTICIVWVCNI